MSLVQVRWWAHPRSRGENVIEGTGSPHPRRLIPAHAGKISSAVTLATALPGSSPLTRGKSTPQPPHLVLVGLIPAHAGKMMRAVPGVWIDGAHPRSRGENNVEQDWISFTRGSSPLTRGKFKIECANHVRAGLIPAHAGKICARVISSSVIRAHPRSRGENSRLTISSRPSSGSSPLTRGKSQPMGATQTINGLIPAHAGKISSIRPTRDSTAAHPRSRGENARPEPRLWHWWGSSPLTRGKFHFRDREPGHQRLIPAHAGKMQDRCPRCWRTRAHPRSRGENPAAANALEVDRGSSPLTRGKCRWGG